MYKFIDKEVIVKLRYYSSQSWPFENIWLSNKINVKANRYILQDYTLFHKNIVY